MAKLNSYYTLCPLIDQQNLLGVERDSEPGCAIVTLGRNIVIRYKLQDLKQLSSWSSKERLTTQVIYDKSTNRYVAVFNERRIRIWSSQESDLNNVKGYKFPFPLHTILALEDLPLVIVRQNGSTASLEWALRNRKSWYSKGILKPGEELANCQLIRSNDKIYICALTKIGNTHEYVVVKLQEDGCLKETDRIRRIELKRTSEELVGHVVIKTKNSGRLLTLWSHGRLYAHSLTFLSSEPGTHELISVIANINTKYPVVMTAVNETTIALYGADASEEGAILMIYNIQFKLVQASQKLKLYTKDAKLWKVEDRLLLAANRHLAIAPYYLAPQRIAAILGSSERLKSKDPIDEEEIMIIHESTVAQWEDCSPESIKLVTDGISGNIFKEVSSYINEGSSDVAIQERLIPRLIDSKDASTIVWCLDRFKDLPEKLLTDLLAFSLRTPNETFIPLQNGAIDIASKRNIFSLRNDFLDRIVSIDYSDISLLSYLRTGINFDETLRLLSYLIEKLDTREESSLFEHSPQPTDRRLYEWSILLLDSHYQHYVLSRDSRVLILLNKLAAILEEHFQLLKDLKSLRPILSRVVGGKSLKISPKDSHQFYSIEEINLY